MDSLFRRYYVPKLVIREVRLSENETKNEIIDGQQRITTVQNFFDNKYKLPNTLGDLNGDLPGKTYEELNSDIKKFINKSVTYKADVILNIDEPHNPIHQMTATEIFSRLQQGAPLNPTEIGHAQLSSLTRNFIVKYADNQTFNYEDYTPVEDNTDKLNFFSILKVGNVRMEHLKFMSRFVMIEQSAGYADLGEKKMEEFIYSYKEEDGIGNNSFEEEAAAQATLSNLKTFYEIFKDDTALDDKSGIPELKTEYFIISIYMLIRHIKKYYVLDDDTKTIIRDFVHNFHQRWSKQNNDDDTDILSFRNNRQQGAKELETRDIIIRQIFFEYLQKKEKTILRKDKKRAFSELERILIYRRGKGLCAVCVTEGKDDADARVGWSKYQADHVIPHAKGGQTTVDNAQLLCASHNQSKGAKT
jgi:5-methylcytosine-specific restriction endonuclease McrA